MTCRNRILICANPDLNHIDGSSIWAQTITLLLAETGDAEVDFLARSVPQRYELFGPLRKHPRIRIVSGPTSTGDRLRPRLSLEKMSSLAVQLDAEFGYDAIVVRGYDIVRCLLDAPSLLARAWVYLTDIPQSLDDCDATTRQTMQRIAEGCSRLLCQTEGFARLWHTIAPRVDSSKFIVYPPVIPDPENGLKPIAERPLRAVYAGKFASDWHTLEMAGSWPEIQRRHPGATLLMLGDKIHLDGDDFRSRMEHALKHTPGLEWPGALPRDRVQEELRAARVGLSWRCDTLDSSIEYSTKLLEYGGAGCAAILNRNPLHESLLGKDYPLFANSREGFVDAVDKAMSHDDETQEAADRVRKLAMSHAFGLRVREAKTWIDALPLRQHVVQQGKPHARNVLVAGHDLKFFAALQRKLTESGRFRFLVDAWQGHDHHDARQSEALLQQADIIVCEWCLGNLRWYSQNRLPHQRLVARFHLQERELPYVAESDWDRIDHIAYVSEFIRREGQSAFGFPEERTSVIANYLDKERFFPLKKTGDARYTLGLIGAAPMRKRLDLAVDLLERLLEHDRRYCLRVKGRHPLDYPWLLNRSDETAYYRRLFERINSHPMLSTRVIFDPPGDDVNEWLSLVGFILSPSDFESFHMAIGEGWLAGCRPIVWPWNGAAEIWGDDCVVAGVDQAQDVVLAGMREETPALPAWIEPKAVVAAWARLLDGT